MKTGCKSAGDAPFRGDIIRRTMNRNVILALLVSASVITMMSTDLYVPSLAHLPELLGTSPELVKLTVSLNIAAYGIATLVHGPLSERFGRKPVLLWGLTGFTLASLLCAAAADIGQLLFARVLQGVAAAVEGVVVLAVIRDVFTEKEQVRAIAIYGIATAFAPAVAPLIGGYIHVYFGWRMNFYLLTGLALLVTLLVTLLLEESTEKDYNALDLKEIFADYFGLLSNRLFLLYIIIAGCSLGSIFVFITAGPFVLIKNHGVATEHFGYFQGVLVLAYIIGSLLATRMAGRYSPRAILRTGVYVAVSGSLLLLAVIFSGMETPVTLVLALAVIVFAEGPIFAVIPTLAMNSTDKRTGAAAAMIVAAEMGIGSLAALAVSWIHDGTSWPMVLTIQALVVIIVLAYLWSGRRPA